MNKIDELTGIMNSNSFNSRGDHLNCDCPFCGKKGHFYVNVNKFFEVLPNGKLRACWDCKKCGEYGNAFKLMREVGRLDFIESYLVPLIKFDDLSNRLDEENEELQKAELPHVKMRMPLGYRRIRQNDYLAERGFKRADFNIYEVGKTTLLQKYENYLLFPFRENGDIVTFYGRYKEKTPPTFTPKYINPQNNHSNYLYGIDDRTFLTNTAIVVEGFFDKHPVDKYLGLLEDTRREVICIATSGKKISKIQALKLKSAGIEELIFGYDPDATNSTKKVIEQYCSDFKIRVAWIGDDESDLGEKKGREIREIFSDNLYNYENFRTDKVFNKLFH
jgi:hypothetical protein